MTFASDPGATLPVVLLVEDHHDSRQMYAEFLSVSFQVIEAADGEAALQLLDKVQPQVVVTDLALPRVDGFELIGRIRTDARLRGTAIIALSGYSTPEHTERAREAGADLILLKPCLPESLAEAVAAAISDRNDRQ